MVLDSNTSLELLTDTGSDVHFVAYAVNDSGTAIAPVFGSGASNGSTPVAMIAAPSSTQFRVVKSVTVRNAGSAARIVTVRANVSGTARVLRSMTLQAGETLEYNGSTWVRADATGRVMTGGFSLRSAVSLPESFSTANLTSAKAITSASSFAVYIGKAPRSYSAGESISIRLRVTTAAATITWAEVAVATGSVNPGANPTLTVRGFADVSASYNSLGQKTTAITLASGQAIAEGDDIWVVIGNQATTALQVRAQSVADDLQAGLQASLATRPSLNIGNGQAYTIEAATVLAAWVAVYW